MVRIMSGKKRKAKNPDRFPPAPKRVHRRITMGRLRAERISQPLIPLWDFSFIMQAG